MDKQRWDTIIQGKGLNLTHHLSQVLRYRDLLFLFVRRDLVTVYKQTILGPLWLILQPLLTALTFTLIFGRLAGLAPGGVPPFIFYYSGILLWTLFAEIVQKTSDTFITNSDLFSKVYFPRVILPLSVTLTSAVRLLVNLVIFAAVIIYYYYNGKISHTYSYDLLLLPLLMIITMALALGCGLFITSLTTRYRDVKFLVQFGLQLLMFLSPVIYPLSLTTGKFREFILYNPVTAIIENCRKIFLGSGEYVSLGYTAMVALIMLCLGSLVFIRTEKSFIDTV